MTASGRSTTGRSSDPTRRARASGNDGGGRPSTSGSCTRQTCLREPAGAAREVASRELLLSADAGRDDTMSSGLSPDAASPRGKAFGGRRERRPKGRSSGYWSTCVARFRNSDSDVARSGTLYLSPITDRPACTRL